MKLSETILCGMIVGAMSAAFESVDGALCVCVVAAIVWALPQPATINPKRPAPITGRHRDETNPEADADAKRLRRVENEIAYRVVSGQRRNGGQI